VVALQTTTLKSSGGVTAAHAALFAALSAPARNSAYVEKTAGASAAAGALNTMPADVDVDVVVVVVVVAFLMRAMYLSIASSAS
jgi:hypothetical protein